MAVIDPRGFTEHDMQSAKIGGPASKRPQDYDRGMHKVIMRHGVTGEEVVAIRQNIHDLTANGYELVGPAPAKVGKLAAAQAAEEVDENDGEGEGEGGEEDNDAEAKSEALNELEVLRQEADALGVKYHPNSGKRKLQEAITLARAAKAAQV